MRCEDMRHLHPGRVVGASEQILFTLRNGDQTRLVVLCGPNLCVFCENLSFPAIA